MAKSKPRKPKGLVLLKGFPNFEVARIDFDGENDVIFLDDTIDFSLKAPGARKLAAWLIRAADYLEIKHEKK